MAWFFAKGSPEQRRCKALRTSNSEREESAGAAATFIGFGLPAFLLMVGLSTFYGLSHALPPVIAAFNGSQAIVVAIVANATVMSGKTSVKDLRDIGIALIAAVLFALGVSPILIIVLAAMLGVLVSNRSPPPVFAL